MEKQIFSYRIPDRFFKPYPVTVPFHAKVVYTVNAGMVVIEEVAVAPRCLRYINNTSEMMLDIERQLDIRIACRNESVHETMRSVVNGIAPHI